MSYEPDSELTFTWAWAFQEEPVRREVNVRAVSSGDGTRLEIAHGPHVDSAEEQEEAKACRDGWAFFLPQLAACLSESSRQQA